MNAAARELIGAATALAETLAFLDQTRERAAAEAQHLEKIVDRHHDWPFSVNGSMDIAQRANGIRHDLGGEVAVHSDITLSDIAQLIEEANETVDIVRFLLERKGSPELAAA